jgi:hypothetical protein
MSKFKDEKERKQRHEQIFESVIRDWDDYDLRIACSQFDVFECGCLYCEFYNMEFDQRRLNCHLEHVLGE